jgi:maltooligosyltrehalose trehalohydrolase
MLCWYRQLIALRRAHPELTDPRLDRLRAEFSEGERWLVLRRGRLRIAASLGPCPRRLPLAGRGAAILAASCPGVALDGESVAMPPAAFAVVQT